MKDNTDLFLERIKIINQLAKDINEINEDKCLPHQSKYKEIMFFVCEMVRIAIGLDDHQKNIEILENSQF